MIYLLIFCEIILTQIVKNHAHMTVYYQYDDIFYFFISMFSWLEGEERELQSEGFSDKLKGVIEGRVDCMVRERLEEEETSFLSIIGITSQIHQNLTNHHLNDRFNLLFCKGYFGKAVI